MDIVEKLIPLISHLTKMKGVTLGGGRESYLNI